MTMTVLSTRSCSRLNKARKHRGPCNTDHVAHPAWLPFLDEFKCCTTLHESYLFQLLWPELSCIGNCTSHLIDYRTGRAVVDLASDIGIAYNRRMLTIKLQTRSKCRFSDLFLPARVLSCVLSGALYCMVFAVGPTAVGLLRWFIDSPEHEHASNDRSKCAVYSQPFAGHSSPN